MIERIEHEAGGVLGFPAVEDVTKADYGVLVPAVQAAVDEHRSIRLLLDLAAFHWEKVDAWGADLAFGREYRDRIEKLAIVGDRSWQRYLAKLAEGFYAREARFFGDEVQAWAWLDEGRSA